LKAGLFDDAFDAAGAHGVAGLTQLLGDDVRRGVGVEKTVADDLADDLLSAHRWTFGPAFLTAESGRPLLVKELQELVIARPAKAELDGRVHGAEAFALSLDEHEESLGGLVVTRHEKLAHGAHDSSLWQLEMHDGFPRCPASEVVGRQQADRGKG
jgi:hypothetical protein